MPLILRRRRLCLQRGSYPLHRSCLEVLPEMAMVLLHGERRSMRVLTAQKDSACSLIRHSFFFLPLDLFLIRTDGICQVPAEDRRPPHRHRKVPAFPSFQGNLARRSSVSVSVRNGNRCLSYFRAGVCPRSPPSIAMDRSGLNRFSVSNVQSFPHFRRKPSSMAARKMYPERCISVSDSSGSTSIEVFINGGRDLGRTDTSSSKDYRVHESESTPFPSLFQKVRIVYFRL